MSETRARCQEPCPARNAELLRVAARIHPLCYPWPTAFLPASCPVGQENHPIAEFCKSLKIKLTQKQHTTPPPGGGKAESEASAAGDVIFVPRQATHCPAVGYPASVSRDRMNDRIDEAVLALLYLGICERDPMTGVRAWKSFDWEAMDRLHGKGLIFNPVSKAKSVKLTEVGRSGRKWRIVGWSRPTTEPAS